MARGRSLAELLAALERRIASGEPDLAPPEPVECGLPPGQVCRGGWHLRRDGGRETAYGRCPRRQTERAEAAAREVPGAQTFESFDRLREPAAFQATRAWVEVCQAGGLSRGAKLALLKPEALPTNTGCGKTHLLRAAARELTRSGRWVALVTAAELSAVVRGRALFDPGERSEAEIQAKQWSRADVLVLDDLGQEETSGPATASFLVGLLDLREGRALGWSSNLAESGLLGRYGAPLVSRLLAGAATPGLQGRDFRRFRARGAGEEGTA
jgi:DNA replication protein DnaC